VSGARENGGGKTGARGGGERVNLLSFLVRAEPFSMKQGRGKKDRNLFLLIPIILLLEEKKMRESNEGFVIFCYPPILSKA